MSVIFFGQEEWQKLFNTLYHYHNSNNISSRIRIFNEKDIEEAKVTLNICEKNHTENDALQHLLACFIRKIALANQITYAYAYYLDRGQKFEMEPCIELKDPEFNDLFTHRQLFKQIGSIIYNCLSNGGTNFLTADLMEKLQEIQIGCAYRMVEG